MRIRWAVQEWVERVQNWGVVHCNKSHAKAAWTHGWVHPNIRTLWLSRNEGKKATLKPVWAGLGEYKP